MKQMPTVGHLSQYIQELLMLRPPWSLGLSHMERKLPEALEGVLEVQIRVTRAKGTQRRTR